MTDAQDRKTAPPESASSARRLTTLYVLALSTVALLTIVAQLLIQRQLQTGESDSRVINVAGRQRMLSQRLAKAALRLDGADDDARRGVLRELSETLDDWSARHVGLRDGDARLGLPGGMSPRVNGLFDEIQPHFTAMREAAERLLGDDRDAAAIEAIQQHEAPFLATMEAIVSQLVVEAEGRLTQLRRLERVLLALTLMVLFVEGLFIFRPAVRRIKQTVAALERFGEQLRVARDEAEAANEAKSRFLANVSHELRTPMTAVLGMTELAREATDPASRERCLTIVEEAGESLLRLLNDLIDTAKIEADELTLVDAPFQPAGVTRRVAELMRPLAEQKGIELVTSGESLGTHTVSGDEERLTQVLVNLVNNAIKCTEEGSVRIAGEAVPTPAGGCDLTWVVADTGVGIAPEDQARVFQPFAQADSSRAEGRGGAGLGLSICRRIVEAMGGTIRLDSAPGVGTEVRVEVGLPTATLSVARPVDRSVSPAARPLRVLVVDDAEVNQLLLRRYLESAGHEVRVAANGFTAFEALGAEPFDAVVTDYRLGDGDGTQVAEEARRRAAEREAPLPPVVCVTADADAASRHTELAVFDAVLTKPFRRGRLLEQVHTLCDPGDTSRGTVAGAEDDGFDAEITAVLCDVLPKQLEELRTAIDRRDANAVHNCSHRLRGQIGYFDERDLETGLACLEDAAKRQEPERIASLSIDLLPRLDRFLASLSTA